MLYFICCSRNNGVIKEGSILRWMMCALERLVLSRNEKEMSAEIAVKGTGFREMIGAWLLTHQLPQKLLCWQACLVVSLVSK